MADLPSILGGLAQGFVDFGKGAVDMFGTGGAAIGDLIESARTGKVTTKNQDDFRKWLYQTDSTKDASAKGLGTALNGVQTVLDYIPGVNVLTRNPLGNAAQGALGGLADEFKTYGEDYDLGRAGQRAAVSGAAAAASGSLADALKGSSNALLSSNTLQGLARGATGGAISGGGYAAIDGGDVLEAAKQGAGMGALIGGATGLAQDFKPAKTYDMALTDSERQARIANIDDQLSKLDTSTPEGNARYNELMNTRDNYLPTARALETTLADADMAVNNQTKSPDGAQNYRTFATGDEAREYFGNSNPGYWDKAPGYDDIQEYTRNGYSRVNDMLRTGQDNYGYPDTDIMIDNIERGIDGYDLKDDIKVYRKSNADVYKNLKVGDTFTDNGFTSASVTPEIGGDFGKANIEIDVGKGKGVGAFIGDLSSGYGDEGEFLLQRGTKYKVVGKDGDKLKLEVVGNERKPLEQILANQDLSVNSAKIAPGQLGLFDDMPTQAPKTGTRQTSLFDQPDNPYLDYYGADIDTAPLTPEAPAISSPVDRSVEDLTKIAIDESTLPKGWGKAQELANMGKRAKQIVLDPNDPNRAQNEYNVALYSDAQYGRNMPVADVIDRLGQIQYGREIDRGAARLLADQLDESGDEFAKKFVTGAAEAGGNISHYRDAPKAKLADEQLSNLLNIGRSNSMLSDSLANPSARNVRGDQWKGTINLDGKSIAKGSDGGISTFGHERLHAFQDAGNMGYDKRVVDAYNELHDDLSKIYHSDSQIRKDYGGDVKYWGKPIEQEARMAQFYLEDKFGVKGAHKVPERDASGKAIRYKDDGTIADPNNLHDYYTGKPAYKGEFEGDRKAINAAFDKFRGKLQDLTRKGVALPAFLTLLGGGAYMASQENDKEKEVK